MCTWKAILLCLVFTLPDITLLSSPINLTSASSQPPSTSLQLPPNPHQPHFTFLPTPIYLTSASSQPPSISFHPPPNPHLLHFTFLPTPIYLTSPSSQPPSASLHPPPNPICLTSPSFLPQSPFLCMAPMVPLHQHNPQLLQRCRRRTLTCCTPLTVMIWESATPTGLPCSP